MSALAEAYEHNGVKVNIYYDQDAMNPRDDHAFGSTFVAWHRRSNLGDEGFNYRDLPRFDLQADLENWLREEHGALHIRPLYLYEHSGMTISLGAFGDPWDSGQVGYVFVTNEHLAETQGREFVVEDLSPEETTDMIAIADRLIAGDVEEYDSYLRGEVYGFVVDEDGDNEESCWGFVGEIDHCKGEANLAANGVAESRVEEAAECAHWAARDVATV